MAEEIKIGINLEAGKAGQTVKELKQEIKELTTQALQAKEAGNNMLATEFINKAAAAKEKIKDINEEIKAFDSGDRAKNFQMLGNTLTMGFRSAADAAKSFGVENKAVEGILQSLSGVSAAAAAAQAASDIKRQLEIVKLLALEKLHLVQTNLQTAAEEGSIGVRTAAAAAQRLLNAAMAANPIGAVIVALTALVAVGAGVYKMLTTNTEASEKLARANEALHNAVSSLNNTYNAQIGILQAMGGQEEKILQLKKIQAGLAVEEEKRALQLLILKQKELEYKYQEMELNTAATIVANGYNKIIQANLKSQMEENQKLINEKIEGLKKITAEEKIAEINITNNKKEQEEEREKKAKEAAEKRKKEIEDEERERKAAHDRWLDYQKNRDADMKLTLTEREHAFIEGLRPAITSYAEEQINAHEEVVRRRQEKEAAFYSWVSGKQIEKVEQEKVTNAQIVQLAQQSIQATQKLSDLYFQWQFQKSKGNLEKERELKKKQFQVNKAMQIANTVVNTISSVMQALGNNAPPLSWILAGINATMGTISVASLAAQKFDDGGGGGGGSAPAAGTLAGTAAISGAGSTPQLNPTQQTSTQLSEEGSVKRERETKTQKVVLVETDVKDTTKRVDTIESRSTF